MRWGTGEAVLAAWVGWVNDIDDDDGDAWARAAHSFRLLG